MTAGHLAALLVALGVWVLGLNVGHANPVATVAIAGGVAGVDDVTQTALIGPSGEIYDPDTPGTWRRRTSGGVAITVAGAVQPAASPLFVAGVRTPLFRFEQGTWHAHHLANRGRFVMATGGVPALAIGRHIYTWRDQRWLRLASVQSPVTALWAASSSRVYAATSDGQLQRIEQGPGGPRFDPVTHPLVADDRVIALAGKAGKDLYALAQSGMVVHLGAGSGQFMPRTIALATWYPNVMAMADNGALWFVGVVRNDDGEPLRTVLARTLAGTITPVENQPTLAPDARIAVLRVDRGGGVLVATQTGSVQYRLPAQSWQQGNIIGELTTPLSSFPGRGPAYTR